MGNGYTIQWELVNNPSISASLTGNNNTLINFPIPGAIYHVKCWKGTGTFSQFRSLNVPESTRVALTGVVQWGTTPWSSFGSAFYGCINFNSIPIGGENGPITSSLANTSYMFSGAVNFNQPIDNLNTSNVTNMAGMFQNASSFNQPLSNLITTNVADMSNMFFGATNFNQPVNNFDTRKVTTMNRMFCLATNFNQSLNNFNTSSVTDMSYFFLGAKNFNQPLNGFNTSAVTSMRGMFGEASNFNQPLDNFNTSAVTNMYGMFAKASNFNQPLDNFNTSLVTNMYAMFSEAQRFNRSLSNWNLNSLVEATAMFNSSGMDCKNYTKTLDGWAANPNTSSDVLFSDQLGRIYSEIGNNGYIILDNDKGWTMGGDVSDNGACFAALPATFGKIQAILTKNRLKINWEILSEVQVKEYVTQLSYDGKSWKNIATVKAQGLNGNSNKKLNYTCTYDVVMLSTVGILSLLLLPIKNKKQRVLLLAVCLLLIIGCGKRDVVKGVEDRYPGFIRIMQFDIDGTIRYSKVINVIEG